MNNPTNDGLLTTKQLIIGLAVALVAGAGLTIFVILPAETGQDPTGFGESTGLNQLANADAEVAEPTTTNAAPAPALDADTLYISIDPEGTEPELDKFGTSLPAVDGANIRKHPQAYKTETLEIQLPTDGKVEYKAIMEEGEMLLYSWEADGDLYYDFHAHQAEGNPDFWTRYAEGEGKTDHGSIVAPYDGQHGWFWLNINDAPVNIKLTVSGYYDEVIEIDMSGEY